MIIALIGDVHANLPALEAVMDHARKEGAVEFWNTGDFVGYGAFPDEVVQILKKEATRSIIGNYDQKVLRVTKKIDEWKKTKPKEKWMAFSWAYENLAKENLGYLRSLPQELRFSMHGNRILIVHGSPLSAKEHLGPDTPVARLRALSKAAKADVIICGHSHLPFVLELDGVHFVNPGSVGRPDDGDPRASYATLKIKSRGIKVTHHRVAYNVERAVEAI
ncbi:MAG: metallophosphoesterase family protein [bacterium]